MVPDDGMESERIRGWMEFPPAVPPPVLPPSSRRGSILDLFE